MRFVSTLFFLLMATWTVDTIFTFTKFLMRNNQAGSISASDFNIAWNGEQSAYMSDLLGRFQNRSNGKDMKNTGLIQNETIMTKLTPFTKTVLGIAVTGGAATKPSDFIYTLAVRAAGQKVFQVDHDGVWALTEDVIDPPSITDGSYYYTESGNVYNILPTTTPTIDLDYICTVTDIVWAFTLDGNNRQVYDHINSIQPLWTNNSIIEITKRTLKSFGVSFKDQDFAGFGASNIVTGD